MTNKKFQAMMSDCSSSSICSSYQELSYYERKIKELEENVKKLESEVVLLNKKLQKKQRNEEKVVYFD